MRLKLLMLSMLTAILPALADTGVTGIVINSTTGTPFVGATVSLPEQGKLVVTGPAGDFRISHANPGETKLVVTYYGYAATSIDVVIEDDKMLDLGKINLGLYHTAEAEDDYSDLLLDDYGDEEDNSTQFIGTLSGATDDIYYSTANYSFSSMRFAYRGLKNEYATTYINGVPFDDLARGGYFSNGGLSRAFRNKTSVIATNPANFGFTDFAGANNISTIPSEQAPGFNGSLAFTNSNYKYRAMATYNTGLNKNGWGFSISAVGRYADEGIVPGTFYNSGGLFFAVQKELNRHHMLTLTAWGAPTQRATSSATYEEAFELAGTNLYNPNWGWYQGKKRSAKIVNSFDPTAILNWIWKPTIKTSLNTSLMFRHSEYSSSALNWRNAADPRPDYYKYLPSYYKDKTVEIGGQEVIIDNGAEIYEQLWRENGGRQIDWDALYYTNMCNTLDPTNDFGASYILEDRHSNQNKVVFSTSLSRRISDILTIQGGGVINYTQSSYYKTIRDLLGAEYWLDVDNYSERDFPDNPDMMQNDLNNPNRKVGVGDRFGYDYNINAIQAYAWLQNTINTRHWDVNFGFKISYTQFQRDGKMRNGRAPDNSYGKGATHRFDNAALKLGATYKINGRTHIRANAQYETRAPLYEYAYISPRIKDDAISGLTSERLTGVDLSYVWNFRRFRGAVTGYWIGMFDVNERTSFYDDQYSTYMNYVLRGVKKVHKGIEIGLGYKITPSVTAQLAGTISSYRYKNRPMGVRSYENGVMPDTTQVVYLKNFFVGSTPQTAFNFGIDWQAPKSWFFNVNCTFLDDAYVTLSPVRHEAKTELWKHVTDVEALLAKIEEIGTQEKLNSAFLLNCSVGKIVNLRNGPSLNFNLSVNNILNNRNVMATGYQQGRFDYTNYDMERYPNKYMYSQGIRLFLNMGIRF
ncbi:MAG: TonB-dependent receptor [Muribaculaceae bacterium]|nr:TonB-dependent receptor [Muribaculaceae bacterium]